jgi:hypothetical protein
MPFDETRYSEDFIKKLRGARTLPEDLMARYAITLPSTDPAIREQVLAVRAYWNKIYQGKSHAAQVARMCRAEDERLRAQHGPSMETRTWWQQRQSERRSAAQASITLLADELKQTYSPFGVVTSGIVDRFSGKLGLTRPDAVQAVQQAGLTLVDGAAIPESDPMPNFGALLKSMAEGAVSSVPELVHPGAGPFSLLDRYTCRGDSGKRLDVVAVDAQIAEADRHAISVTEDARRGALKILRRAVKDGVDLRDIALYHLVTVAREFLSLSPGMAAAELQKLGLDRKDAAVIAVVTADQSSASGAASLSNVQSLVTSGRLNEARQAALSLPLESSTRADAVRVVDAARERLDDLLAEVQRALKIPDEVRATALLREAAVISIDDADERLATVPLPPPADPRAVCDGSVVKLFWQPASGHDDGTQYVVTRTEQRSPAAVSDGTAVCSGQLHSCTDAHAPVARIVQYGLFALADGRPPSRAAVVPATLLPPVGHVEADVGPDEITVHWSVHPDAQCVLVTRTMPGSSPKPVTVTGNSCHLTGLPEGQPQHLEITAIYRGLDGTEMRSPTEQINATPRSEAKPIPRLRVRPVEVGGVVRIRVAWTPIDNSEVRILRSDAPPRWPFGTWVSPEQMAQFGQEVTGRLVAGQTEVALEAEVAPGVHHLVPFSIGGTGVVVGRSSAVGVTDPVKRLVVTPFATYATLSWEWPPTAQLAEVSWELDGDADSAVIGLAQYRSQGGARVPLGRGPCTVEVRAVIMADAAPFTSPPATAVIDSVLDVEIGYAVSSTPTLGPFGGRSKRVIFTSAEGCAGVQIRMVATPGRVMPTSAEDGFALLNTALALEPGVPVEHQVTIPKPVKRPYWVRCFVVSGQARLVDPPISSLKES